MQDDATDFVINERDFQLKRMEETRYAIHQARESGDWSKVPRDVYEGYLAKVILTTLPALPERRISATLGVLSAEILVTTKISDVRSIGSAAISPEQKIEEAGASNQEKLRNGALACNADAVVDVKTQYNLIGSEDQQVSFLVVSSGTAVQLA